MQYSDQDITAYSEERAQMVKRQLKPRGVNDPRVLDAMTKTPRHLFVDPSQQDSAYADHPVRIACGQTISQPYIVAAMTEMLCLRGTEHVLEIGTGVGYQTAILAQLAAHVVSVERHPALADGARQRLEALGYNNIIIVVGDGSQGYPAHAPYDRILVTAGAPAVPASLKQQLADQGRLIAPVGGGNMQRLVTIRRFGDSYERQDGMPCRFVPLIGAEGWPDPIQ